MTDLTPFEQTNHLYLFTSLTAGSSHIITATSRLETILKANKIPFQAIDTATSEPARKLWQRRGRGKKLPGLVKEGFVVADLEEVEEWNEFGELKENIGPVAAPSRGGSVEGVNVRPVEGGGKKSPEFEERKSESQGPSPLLDRANMVALPGAAEIAAKGKGGQAATNAKAEPKAMREVRDDHPSLDHLSAPASAVHSGTATPDVEPAYTARTVTGDTGLSSITTSTPAGETGLSTVTGSPDISSVGGETTLSSVAGNADISTVAGDPTAISSVAGDAEVSSVAGEPGISTVTATESGEGKQR